MVGTNVNGQEKKASRVMYNDTTYYANWIPKTSVFSLCGTQFYCPLVRKIIETIYETHTWGHSGFMYIFLLELCNESPKWDPRYALVFIPDHCPSSHYLST